MLSGGGFPCAFYPESPRTRCWLLACKDRSRNILCFDFSATPAPEPLTQEECSQRHEGCGNSLLLASFVYDKRFASGQKEAFVNLRFLVITCICCCGLTVAGQKSAPTKRRVGPKDSKAAERGTSSEYATGILSELGMPNSWCASSSLRSNASTEPIVK